MRPPSPILTGTGCGISTKLSSCFFWGGGLGSMMEENTLTCEEPQTPDDLFCSLETFIPKNVDVPAPYSLTLAISLTLIQVQ